MTQEYPLIFLFLTRRNLHGCRFGFAVDFLVDEFVQQKRFLFWAFSVGVEFLSVIRNFVDILIYWRPGQKKYHQSARKKGIDLKIKISKKRK